MKSCQKEIKISLNFSKNPFIGFYHFFFINKWSNINFQITLKIQKSFDSQTSSPQIPNFVLQGVLDDDLDKRVDEMLEKGLLQELLGFHTAYNSERLARES